MRANTTLAYVASGGFVAACAPVERNGHVHVRYDFVGEPPTEAEVTGRYDDAVAVATITEG